MKGFDPHLIKWIIVGLIFVVRAVVATNKKRQAKNQELRPPQSSLGPPPIASPTVNQSQPVVRQTPKTKPSDADSPWSTSKGPFD